MESLGEKLDRSQSLQKIIKKERKNKTYEEQQLSAACSTHLINHPLVGTNRTYWTPQKICYFLTVWYWYQCIPKMLIIYFHISQADPGYLSSFRDTVLHRVAKIEALLTSGLQTWVCYIVHQALTLSETLHNDL